MLRDRLHHQLIRLGTESLLIANRTFDRAVDLAYALGGTALPFDSYVPYLKIADVVIGSLTTDRLLLARDDIESVLRDRKYRPMFFIDLGVPRNFHEGLNDLDNAISIMSTIWRRWSTTGVGSARARRKRRKRSW